MMEGRQISNYRILEKIGRGGMGAVYKAEDTVLKRTVALKFFLPEVLEDKEARARLVREARAASVLDHPNVCTIHEVQETEDGELFICMGYCEGETLRKRLQGPLPGISDALDIAVQIAEGLEHAHERGIIHCDVKPENVAISPQGRVRIMDFGLARLRDETKRTRTGTAAGTPAYMSPEQVKGLEVDHRSDIWSLGITLYELVTGKPPFGGMYEAAALYSIVNEKPTSPTQVNPAIPVEVEEIILRALEKRPEKRYQSMKEFAEDLERARSEISGDVRPGARAAKGKLGRRKTRRRIMYAALVGIAGVAATMLMVDTFSVDPRPVSVAVMDFKNTAGEEEFETMLAGLLITDLAQSPNVKVLSRARIAELREYLNIDKVDELTAFDLAGRAGAEVLISGEVLRDNDKMRIKAEVFDVNTRELLFARHKDGGGPGEVFDMIDSLSRDIRKGLKVIPRWGRDAEPSLTEMTTGSLDAYRLFSRGQELRNSKPEEAAALIEQAVARDTTFAEAHMELALLYNHQLGDRGKALENALKAKELSKDKSPKEYLKSLVYESWVRRDWDDVTDYMSEYLELQPNDMRIRRRLGWVYAREESTYDKAIGEFTRMIELDSTDLSGEIGPAYNHLGTVFMYLGRFEEAIAAFKSYEALSPGSPAPAHSIGRAYTMSGRYDEAVGKYLEILETYPGYYISYESLGMTYLAMGRWRDALTAFARYLAAAPAGYTPNARTRLAEVYYKQGQSAQANQEIGEALYLDDKCCRAHWLKGLVALAAGGTAGARAELAAIEEALGDPSLSEEAAYSHHLAGRIHLAEGKKDEGLRDLRLAVETSGREETYFFKRELVRGCVDAGLPDVAVREAQKLLRYNANDGELLSLLGLASEQNGDREAEDAYLQRALETWKEADRDFAPLTAIRAKL